MIILTRCVLISALVTQMMVCARKLSSQRYPRTGFYFDWTGFPPLSALLIKPVWSIQNESLPVWP